MFQKLYFRFLYIQDNNICLMEKTNGLNLTLPRLRIFLGKKERDLVKQVNDELIERVIGQVIAYYPIDLEHTNFHSLYNEAIIKTFLPPVRVHALVDFKGQETRD
jgi:hypothetical protein